MSLKSNVESLLFALGRRTTADEIARILRISDHQKVVDALQELKADYDAKAGSIVVRQEDTGWKMTVADEHLPVVRKVVSKTELPKGVMETLAIIAYKAPILQSEIVKLRTNKAYDHLALLQETGFITREKSGRSKLIKLAKKFFDYFDVPEAALKERFSSVAALEQVIGEKEGEIHAALQKQEAHKELRKQEDERQRQEFEEKHKQLDQDIARLPDVDLVDEEGHKETLATYDSDVVDRPAAPPLSPAIEVLDEPETFTLPRERKKNARAGQQATPEPAKPAEVLASEEATGEEKAEALREELDPEATAVEALEELGRQQQAAHEEAVRQQGEPEAPPEGTSKYDPEAIEFEAKKLAKGLVSRESKGMFSEGMTEEIAHQIDEKAARMMGSHHAMPAPSAGEGEEAASSSGEDDAGDAAGAAAPAGPGTPENGTSGHAHRPLSPEAAGDVHVSPEEGENEERKKGGKDPHAHPGGER